MQMRRTILLLLASVAVAHGQPEKPVEDLPGLFLDRSSASRSTDPRLTEPRTATKSEGQGKRNTSSDDPAAQRRIVGIAKEQLARARDQASAGGATRLRLNLLAGVDMTAVIERTARTSRGYSLAGHIAGMEEVSNVVLVVNGAVVMGDVWTPQGHYTIRTAGGGSYLIEKTDPAERKPLGEPILPPRMEGGARGAERRSKNGPQAAGDGSEDDGSTIDIFVFWTQGARLDAGGLPDIETMVDLAIAGANEAYLASDIQTRLNLVGATEVHYGYEGAGQTQTLIDHLGTADDGYMTEVHDVRDAYSSDLVHLFFGPEDADDYAGKGSLWGPFGISVVGSVGTFIHEVGHNMGLHHDAYELVTNANGDEYRRAIEQGEYDEHIRLYGIGYVNQRAFDAGADEERHWKTVMAYWTQCDDNGLYCEELLRLSNPRQRWPDDNGDLMGIAEEDARGNDWPADASRAVNGNIRALANWRPRSARCRFDLSAEALQMPAGGGGATIEVGTSGGASCPWHAVTNDAFVDVAVEGDRVVIRVGANEGEFVRGVVAVAGRSVLLRQLGSVVDHGDSRSDATRVSLPSRTAGGIDPGDDKDYFRFEVSRRGEVVARTTGGLDAEGALYDSSGSVIVRNSDGGEGSNFRIRRELEAGTYYVRVSSRQSDTGAYALHLSSETGGSPDLAVSSLSADRREVDPGERFTLSATVRNRGDARSDATTIRYYRTAGNRDTLLGTNSIPALAASAAASDDFRARAETAPGTYAYKACVAEVSGESNTANNCGSVDVRVRRPSSDDDHGDSRSDATRVSLPSRTTGEIDPGDDEDYFRFEVSRRGEVLARTTGGLDAEGALYDSSGSEIARNSDGGEGNNFRIRRELEAGTYYVCVSSGRAGTGTYALHLSIETGSDGSPDLAVSSLSADRREVDPGERFTLSATVRNSGDARSDATTIRYYRTAGNRDTLLGTNSIRALAPSGTASDDFRARAETAPGTYAYRACVAEVSGESNTANNCGSPVEVRVRRSGGGDDHGDSRSDATRVSLPSETSGAIDAGDDEDYFRFEVLARGEVLARTTGGLDTLGALYDADGAEVATDDDGGAGTNFRIRRQLDAGAYYVRVSSWRAGTGAYALHLSFESATGGGNGGGRENGSYRRTLGDFDGDGRDDVLLRHEDGRWFFYPMNGRRHMAGQGTANLTRNLSWSVAGVGDFDGDGKDDVLLRKAATTGTWYYYPMDGRGHLSGHGAANLPSDLSWSVAGIGDFDGNGKDDVLLRHEDGRWHFYPMNGRRAATGRGTANLTRNLAWSVAGVGDLDGDGRDDVLLRKPTTGTWYYYPMNGRRHLSGRGAANLPSDLSWSLAGIGDFDGDSKDDVLLRHEDGRWHFHPMNGRHTAAGDGRAALTGNLEWSVGGVGDLNGDGKDDVLLRKPATGAWYYYPMNGRLHLPERGGANLTSNRAWGGLFPVGGTSGGANGAPTVATAIAHRSLATGGDATLDLSGHFSDGQTLVYEVRSSDAEVVRVSVTGGVLTLMPVAEGSATVTVTARDPDGNEATQTFSVTVGPSVETFRDCGVCPEMVVVPAGTFLMGAPESEVDSRDGERPVHAVSVPSFAMGVYEVTFEEWDACVVAGGCRGYRPHDEGWGRDRRPVIYVSSVDGQSYVEWLSLWTGERYRLPSESEWEYAARAGTTTPFHTGETITTDQANYSGYVLYPSGDRDPKGVYRGQTVPVGSFGANAFGLHDVLGNAREWVQDCWNGDYEGAPADGSAWLSGDCAERVLRGGSWINDPSYVRAADRRRLTTGRRLNGNGFRVVRTLAR